MIIAYQNHRRVKDMVASERPQERLESLGVEALSDRELLAMILRTGTRLIDVLSISEDLLHEAGSLANLLRWSAEDFSKIHGIGKVKALQLISVMQFAKRLLSEEEGQEVRFDNSAMVAQHFRHLTAGAEVEHF